VAAGADLVLCGHDHQELVDVLDGTVVACAGTLCTRSRGHRPSVFFRVVIEDEAIEVEQYRWEATQAGFRHSDKHQFGRRSRAPAAEAVKREG
jgi:predicted phosphodiesterase